MRQRLATLVRSGAPDLIIATGVAGGSGYLITLVAGVQLGPALYVSFGVLWSSLFLAVGTLNGVQQEVARATRWTEYGSGGRIVRDVVLGIAGAALLAALATYPLWGHLIFVSAAPWLVLPLAVGLVGHTIVTALIGMLHGLHRVRLIAGIVILDALLRLVLTIALLGITRDIAIISWALVFPYAITPVLLWLLARKHLRHASIDVSRRALLRNVGSTILAAAASGAMISGVSLLIAVAGRGAAATHVGAIIFAVNITRAPLIIVVAALQNYVVVRLRDRTDWLRVLLRVVIAAVMLTLVVTAVIALFGEQLFSLLLDGTRIDPVLLALITGSGGLTALLSLTGAALLARGRHVWNTAGWLVAAVVTGISLFAVPDFDAAVVTALIAGPITGIIVHAVAIGVDRQSSAAPSRPSEALDR